tara:strand:- start:1512 stop:1805 length:294 start_codon:yes stop_codon:yes gene_type:complete
MITTIDALESLKPKAQWTMTGDVLEWLDSEQTEPTTSELATEVLRLQAAYDAQAYARSRVSEYPPIGDQLDALWKGGDAQASMLILVNAVKTKYPKG